MSDTDLLRPVQSTRLEVSSAPGSKGRRGKPKRVSAPPLPVEDTKIVVQVKIFRTSDEKEEETSFILMEESKTVEELEQAVRAKRRIDKGEWHMYAVDPFGEHIYFHGDEELNSLTTEIAYFKLVPAVFPEGREASNSLLEMKQKNSAVSAWRKSRRSRLSALPRLMSKHALPDENGVFFMRGPLLKRGARNKNYKQRFLVLCGRELLYYKNEEESWSNKKQLGVIDMSQALDVRLPEDHEFTDGEFQIVTTNRIWKLKVPDERANSKYIVKWMRALKSSMDHFAFSTAPSILACLDDLIAEANCMNCEIEDSRVEQWQTLEDVFSNTAAREQFLSFLRKKVPDMAKFCVEYNFVLNAEKSLKYSEARELLKETLTEPTHGGTEVTELLRSAAEGTSFNDPIDRVLEALECQYQLVKDFLRDHGYDRLFFKSVWFRDLIWHTRSKYNAHGEFDESRGWPADLDARITEMVEEKKEISKRPSKKRPKKRTWAPMSKRKSMPQKGLERAKSDLGADFFTREQSPEVKLVTRQQLRVLNLENQALSTPAPRKQSPRHHDL